MNPEDYQTQLQTTPEPVAAAPKAPASAGGDPVQALINAQPVPASPAQPNGTLAPATHIGISVRRRIARAKLGSHLGTPGHFMLIVVGWALLVSAAGAFYLKLAHIPGLLIGVGLFCLMFAAWWKHELSPLPAEPKLGLEGRLSRDVLSLVTITKSPSPDEIWQAIRTNWQAKFYTLRLMLDQDVVSHLLTAQPQATASIWQKAAELADQNNNSLIGVGHLTAALLLTSPAFIDLLHKLKLVDQDVLSLCAWLSRSLSAEEQAKAVNDFGGIGRDWANGYTPNLDHFGYNVSLNMTGSGSHFDWLAQGSTVQAIKAAFSQGSSAVVLVGETGIGKTSHVYALAQVLLAEHHDRNLEHRQVISLSASMIISSATKPGELEYLIGTLFGEASHAGNIVLFLDDAQLFFGNQTGTFNISKLLLPVIQSRTVQMVLAMTPGDYQRLKATDTSLTSLMTPVVIPEPSEVDVMRVLEDTALGLEHRHKVFITYAALHEAYRLSGRYEQEVAYPGKAIILLEQSLSHATDNVVIPESVQAAVEQTRGVKVSTASQAESNTLLNLEDAIHKRMINQTHAVGVVANALRRARAGVANPRRPVGSFLFLGPTGVGKTELAKSIAAIYFGNEQSLIRLDMSEYQQPDDVKRLLSSGADEHSSLLMRVRQQPYGVVLLDEIEKAHPNVLNLLLQLLDEGTLTDTNGRAASFKDCVIVVTSNAGAQEIRTKIEAGQELEQFAASFTDDLISSGQFKPELLNRFDEIVLFRPLKQEELTQVVTLMLNEVNATLANQNITVELTPAATDEIVKTGYDPRLGARPMRRAVQRLVEDTVAQRILRGDTHPGDHIVLDAKDLPQ